MHAYCQRYTRTSEEFRIEWLLNPPEAWLDPTYRRGPRTSISRTHCARSGNRPLPNLDPWRIDNPHKKAQRIRELHQHQKEVTAALRARKYEQQIARQSGLRLEPLRRVSHNLVVRPQKQRLVKAIRREGPQILEDAGSLEAEEKGHR